MDTNKNLIKETLLKEIEKRFEDQLNESIQQLRSRVEESFRFNKENIIGLKRYKTMKNIQADATSHFTKEHNLENQSHLTTATRYVEKGMKKYISGIQYEVPAKCDDYKYKRK